MAYQNKRSRGKTGRGHLATTPRTTTNYKAFSPRTAANSTVRGLRPRIESEPAIEATEMLRAAQEFIENLSRVKKGPKPFNIPGLSPNKPENTEPQPALAPIPEKLLNHAIEVIGSYDAALKWLTTPSIALGSIQPLEMLLTEKGRQEVDNELTRIEHGVL